jgi:peptidoglycan/LPS O-acetylase OafA/YrhL
MTFSVVFFVGREWSIRLGALMAILSVGVITFGGDFVSVDVNDYCIYNLHFLAGATLCLFYPKLGLKHAPVWIAAGAALFLVAGAVNSMGLADTENRLHRLIEFVPPSLMLLYGVLGLEKRRIAPPRWLLLLGDASYSIYLIHLTLFLAYRRETASISHTPFIHLVWDLGMLASAIITGVAIFYVFEKPVIRAGKSILTGKASVSIPLAAR